MSKNRIPLEPCPFCGSRARMSEVPRCNWYWAECPYCDAETRGEESPEAAAQNWNRRVLPVAPVPPAVGVEADGGAGLSAVAKC